MLTFRFPFTKLLVVPQDGIQRNRVPAQSLPSASVQPHGFTKVVSVVKALFHLDKMPLFQYLDDWLGDAPDKESASLRSNLLVQVCTKLGFLINLEKSDLLPAQQFDFIGMHFDLLEGRISFTSKNLSKVLETVQRFVALEKASAQQWQSLIGVVGALPLFFLSAVSEFGPPALLERQMSQGRFPVSAHSDSKA